MNRPNKNKYINKEFDGVYVIELEKYCDKLEKALDKACERIVELEALIGGEMVDVKTIKRWTLVEGKLLEDD